MTRPSPLRCAALACLLAAAPDAFAQDTTKDFAKDILHDQKQLWTSPFRMKSRDVKWWLIFGAATGVLIATDHRTSQELPNTADQMAYSRGVSRLGAAYTIIPIAGGRLSPQVIPQVQPSSHSYGLMVAWHPLGN
jgi:hypothetical protein